MSDYLIRNDEYVSRKREGRRAFCRAVFFGVGFLTLGILGVNYCCRDDDEGVVVYGK